MQRNKLFKAVLALGILGGWIPTARAAAPTPAQTADPSTLPGFEEELVVTGALEESTRGEVPAPVDVISRQEIQRRHANDLVELLRTVPGLAVAQSGTSGHSASVFSRGTNSNHTLVLWNGVPLNPAFDGRFDFAFLPTDGVDRVEIARGPYSSIYGSALGAVIQVITGSENGGSQGGARLEAGEHSTWRAGGNYGGMFGGAQSTLRHRFDVAALGRRGEGELPNDTYDTQGGHAQARFALTPGWQLGVSARVQDSEAGVPREGSTFTPHRTNQFDERQLSIPLDATLGPAWTLDALLSHHEADLAFRDPDAFFTPRAESDSSSTRVRVGAARNTDSGFLAFGAEGLRESVTYADPSPSIDDAERDNTAVFAQGRWRGRALTAELGVRHDDNEFYGGHTSPRLALAYRLSEVTFHAAAGEAFRTPSFLELYFPFYGNPDLEPETSESYDAGVTWRREGLEASLVGYENRVEDLINGVPPTFLAQNVGRARMRGIEGSFRLRRAWLDARISGTAGAAENLDTGGKLARRPEETASAVVSVLPGRWNATLTAIYVGERPDFDPDTFQTRDNPAYTRLDLGASYEVLPWLRPYARVENLTDERYEEVLGFPAQRRTFTAGVALRFLD